MSVNCKVGSFASPTSLGNQSISDVGFLPTVIIFLYNANTIDGSLTNAVIGIGAAVSSSQRFAISVASAGNSASSVANRRNSGIKCISLINNAGTLLRDADLVSMDSGGFTINWTNINATQHIINYIALGGDVSQAAIGSVTLNTSTGNQSVTGLPFSPDIVLMASNANTTVGTASHGVLSVGIGKSSTARYSIANSIENGIGISDTYRLINNNRLLSILGLASATTEELDLVSLNSDGFTFNITKANVARVCYYIAIKGGQHIIGDDVVPISDGARIYSGLGILPRGIFLFSILGIVFNTINSDADMTLGIGTSVNQASICGEDIDAQDLTESNSYLRQDRVFCSDTDNIFGNLTILANDQFTIDWLNTIGLSMNLIYWAIGDSITVGVPFFTTIDAKRI